MRVERRRDSAQDVWLITSGEPIEGVDGPVRPLRTGLLASSFSSAGHDVTWWTARYNHFTKVQRTGPDCQRHLNGTTVRLLKSCGYETNHSPWRIVDHTLLGLDFRRQTRHTRKPSVIVASFPPIELAAAAVRYGLMTGVPVVVDVRDLWPDLFGVGMSGLRAVLGRAATVAYGPIARWTLSNATALTSITEPMLSWSLRMANRNYHKRDAVFPFGYSDTPPPESAIQSARHFWNALGVTGSTPTFCFSGSINDHVDANLLMNSHRRLRESCPEAQLVVCGAGSRLDSLRESCSQNDGFLFPGWVGRAEIWTLLRLCRAGVVPYRQRFDFEVSVPNKILEYLSAGLPILSTLQGPTRELLDEHGCGATVAYGNAEQMAGLMVQLSELGGVLDTFRQNAQRAFSRYYRADLVYGDMAAHVLGLS
jgi:glycosyltransferase involved in cell wall biosynthesis